MTPAGPRTSRPHLFGSRVWVTRAEPGATRTAERLRAAGFEPVVDPLLETRDLAAGPIDLSEVGALAFTSANAIAAFARRSAERALPAYAVGEATAAAARAAGFTDAGVGAADSAVLARLIAADPHRPAGAILHPSAAELAGDLTGELEREGVGARRLPIYETIPRAPSSDTLAHLSAMAAILLHSPKAARALAEVLAHTTFPSPLVGEGGERSEPDEGSRGASTEANTWPAGASFPPHPTSRSRERPPSPARGEGKPGRGAPRILCLSPAIAEAFGAAARDPRRFATYAAADPTDPALLVLLGDTLS